MQTRKLGTTDLDLTVIGLGTWALGGPWEFGWGPQDDEQALGAICAAVESGINWIDTAPIYGCGHSEELVGKALRQMSAEPMIATKCGLLWDRHRRKVSCLKPDSIRSECHDSLKRLGRERIDLYQMHWPVPDAEIEWAWEAMTRLREEGKVRAIGVSNCTIKQMDRLARIHPVASLQPRYSLLHRDVEGGTLDYCRAHGIGVVAYSPMAMGLLTGKFNAQRRAGLAPDDQRVQHPDFQAPRFSAILDLVKDLQGMAERDRRSVAQLAVAWVLHRPEVTSAIVGARRPAQILETVQAADYTLASEQLETIDALIDEMHRIISPS